MESADPTPDAGAPRDVARCPACRAATAGDQRYCLVCGTLVGERRLDPIEMLTPPVAADPLGGPPSAAAAAPRAVPLAAATAAIVVAGISGMLVTNGGDGTGARAAVIAAAPAPAPAPAPVADSDPAPAAPADDPEPLPVDDPLPAEPLPADDPLPVESEAPPLDTDSSSEAPVDDDTGEDEETADEPAPEAKPRVWLLALEGPQAAEAVERIAAQGVRLSGMTGVAAAAQANASALVGGTRPAVGDPAAGAAGAVDPATGAPTADAAKADAAPSLPAALKAADRRWRAYVDVQPTSGPALPGACAAPAAGDPAASLLASRLPFAAIEGIDCDTSISGLEALGNDLSAGDDIPDFSYVAMGGCAAPERPPIALPDAVEDAVATITSSTEYQSDGMLVVTTVGSQDACTPPVPSVPAVPAPVAPAVDPAVPAPAAPTAVLRPAATAGKAVDTKLDLLALSRAMADVLGLTPPGAAGEDAVPALELPGVAKK